MLRNIGVEFIFDSSRKFGYIMEEFGDTYVIEDAESSVLY